MNAISGKPISGLYGASDAFLTKEVRPEDAVTHGRPAISGGKRQEVRTDDEAKRSYALNGTFGQGKVANPLTPAKVMALVPGSQDARSGDPGVRNRYWVAMVSPGWVAQMNEAEFNRFLQLPLGERGQTLGQVIASTGLEGKAARVALVHILTGIKTLSEKHPTEPVVVRAEPIGPDDHKMVQFSLTVRSKDGRVIRETVQPFKAMAGREVRDAIKAAESGNLDWFLEFASRAPQKAMWDLADLGDMYGGEYTREGALLLNGSGAIRERKGD
jgi:hypothetical protein